MKNSIHEYLIYLLILFFFFQLDVLFLDSMWSNEYNKSEVVSLSPGSLVVRMRLYINSPDPLAANKLGSAFLRGLQKHHEQEWLGSFAIDIESIRFAEILVDTTSILSSTTASTSAPFTTTNRIHVTPTAQQNVVGWGEWSSWSSCNPCSPQYDQIRTRRCRLDRGKGVLLSSIEWCLLASHNGQRSPNDMETRPCQCDHVKKEADLAIETIMDANTLSTVPPIQPVEVSTKSDETTKAVPEEIILENDGEYLLIQ